MIDHSPAHRRSDSTQLAATGGLLLGAGMLAGAVAGLWLARSGRNSLSHFAGKVVLVTGGSRGLGLTLARQLAEQGASLALLARDPAELRGAGIEVARHNVPVLTVPCDVHDPWQVQQAVKHIIDKFGRIDVLINNAGVIRMSPLENQELEDYQESLNVHLWGPLHMVRAVLPHMKERGGGRICNIVSMAGMMALPHLASYTVGKHALMGLSQSLRIELAPHNILVTTILPGMMRTGSHLNAMFRGQHEQEYRWFLAGMAPGFSISAETAAARILDATAKGKAELTFNRLARGSIIACVLAPGLTARVLQWSSQYLLPQTRSDGENKARAGWQIPSRLRESRFLSPLDQLAERNNEKSTQPSRAAAKTW